MSTPQLYLRPCNRRRRPVSDAGTPSPLWYESEMANFTLNVMWKHVKVEKCLEKV